MPYTVSPVNISSHVCFPLNRVENGNADITSEEHFEFQKPGEALMYYYRHFCSNILILSRDPVPLSMVRDEFREDAYK
jgi:hypothetical protein